MMKATITNNVLTVSTGIDAKKLSSYGAKGVTIYDEHSNPVMVIRMAKDGKGAIQANELTCNVILDDGTAAYSEILAVGTTMNSIQKKYADALVRANKCVQAAVAKIDLDTANMEEIFGAEEPEPTVEAVDPTTAE